MGTLECPTLGVEEAMVGGLEGGGDNGGMCIYHLLDFLCSCPNLFLEVKKVWYYLFSSHKQTSNTNTNGLVSWIFTLTNANDCKNEQ